MSQIGARPWHKRWHSRIMGDPSYLSLTMEQRGFDDTLWNMASQSWGDHSVEDGSITVGNRRRLKLKDIVQHLVGITPGLSSQRAHAVLKALKDKGRISVTAAGVVRVCGFCDAQEQAPTPAAERKRRQYEREQMHLVTRALEPHIGEQYAGEELLDLVGSFFDSKKHRKVLARIVENLTAASFLEQDEHGVFTIAAAVSTTADGPAALSAPPSDSGFSVSEIRREISRMGSVISHEDRRPKKENQRFSEVESSTRGGAESAAGPSGLAQSTLWTMDPVSCALYLGQESSQHARNTYRSYLDRLREVYGDEEEAVTRFRDMLNEARCDLDSGYRPNRRGSWLNAKIRKHIVALEARSAGKRLDAIEREAAVA